MRKLSIFIAVCFFWMSSVSNISAQELRRNPFESPLNSATSRNPDAPIPRPSNEKLVLKGILMADGQPLVNFGGHILGVGDQVAGYQLIGIEEEHAIFLVNANEIEMPLYEEREE